MSKMFPGKNEVSKQASPNGLKICRFKNVRLLHTARIFTREMCARPRERHVATPQLKRKSNNKNLIFWTSLPCFIFRLFQGEHASEQGTKTRLFHPVRQHAPPAYPTGHSKPTTTAPRNNNRLTLFHLGAQRSIDSPRQKGFSTSLPKTRNASAAPTKTKPSLRTTAFLPRACRRPFAPALLRRKHHPLRRRSRRRASPRALELAWPPRLLARPLHRPPDLDRHRRDH